MVAVTRSFDDLVSEAQEADVEGWDFSWLDGRASEERPSWGYARSMGKRMATAPAALDLQTGGGEVLAGVPRLPPLTVATESWPPNVASGHQRLHPLGVAVVAHDDGDPLPFADARPSTWSSAATRCRLVGRGRAGTAARRPVLLAGGRAAAASAS